LRKQLLSPRSLKKPESAGGAKSSSAAAIPVEPVKTHAVPRVGCCSRQLPAPVVALCDHCLGGVAAVIAPSARSFAAPRHTAGHDDGRERLRRFICIRSVSCRRPRGSVSHALQ
jgi:hypothetical protein